MLYLLNGDIHQIKEYIDHIIKENNIDVINISRYELDAYNYKDVLEDIESVSLFEDKKVVIVEDALIFSSSKTQVPTEPFENYLTKPNDSTILIFTLEDKIDERKKVTKLIRKIGIVKEYNTSLDQKDVIKNLLGDYKMDIEALSKFIELVPNDYYNMLNEIEKLKLYKDKDLNIKIDDILNITTNNIDNDLFKLMDSIMEDNKEVALSRYNDMLLYNVEPIQIMVALANKYRLLLQVKMLIKLGYKDTEIASELKQSPKYIYVLSKIQSKYSKDYLLKQLKLLSDMDYQIKSGKIDSKLAIELYILKK